MKDKLIQYMAPRANNRNCHINNTLLNEKKLTLSIIIISIILTMSIFTIAILPTQSLVDQVSEKRLDKESVQPKSDFSSIDVSNELTKLTLPFIENVGQIENKDVKFYANTFAGTVFVTEDGGLTYTFTRPSSTDSFSYSSQEDVSSTSSRGVALKERFLNPQSSSSSLHPLPVGLIKSDSIINYFVGNEKEKWHTNIQAYDSVGITEVWPHIDLELRAFGNNIEKIFKVGPGGDVKDIRIAVQGVRGLNVSEKGELLLETELGVLAMTAPIAFQEIHGEIKPVKVSYFLENNGASAATYGFSVGPYDTRHALVIDPELASTYIGGNGPDIADGIAIDSSGNVFVTGSTDSQDYPTTAGAIDESYNPNPSIPQYGDIFVSKLSNDLTSLTASTFLGGSSEDIAYGIAIDSSGNVFVTGSTDSQDYPTTAGAIDRTHGPFDQVVFVSKLSNDLTSLTASTFLGEFGEAIAIAIDDLGNVFLTGYTGSGMPITTGPFYQNTIRGQNVFVSKLSNDLTSLTASTLIGGFPHEQAFAITLDDFGNVFVTGWANNPDFDTRIPYPTTPGAYDTQHDAGSDIFVSKLSNDLSLLLASTFVGGNGPDIANGIAIDSSGNVFVTGRTSSQDYPTTVGAIDRIYNGGDYDIFVSKLSNDLSLLLASTFVGGSLDEFVADITLHDDNGIFITGGTFSRDYPTTYGAFDRIHSGETDFFVSKLSNDLTSLTASTFLGGLSVDSGSGIALDSSNNLFVTGLTVSDLPTTGNNPFDTTPNGGHDLFVSKFTTDLSTFGDILSLYLREARDGNNEEIANGGTTSSDNITFLVGFEVIHHREYASYSILCSLDGGAFSVCPDNPLIGTTSGSFAPIDNPSLVTTYGSIDVLYNGLTPGAHTFTVLMRVTSLIDGSSEIRSETFTWDIITA
jgi:hypothetical protein